VKQSISRRVDNSKTKIDDSTVAAGGSVSQEVLANNSGVVDSPNPNFELLPPSLEMVEVMLI